MSSKRIALDRTLVVGVDVASEEHIVLIRGPVGLEVGPFPFANDRSGFRLLASKVSEARAASEVEEMALALEPKGSYGEALAGKRGVGAGLKTRSWVLRRAVRGLRGFEREIATLEARMERWLKRIPYGACLLSMPGVGVVTAASLLGEFVDLRDYPGTGELLKFCGLNLVSFSSGKRRGRNRISSVARGSSDTSSTTHGRPSSTGRFGQNARRYCRAR